MRRLVARTASGRYDVLVGRGLLPELGSELAARHGRLQAVVCSDEHVAPLHLDAVLRSLAFAGHRASTIVIPAGETQKNLGRAEELYGVLYDRGLRRSDAMIALGGGVIGDLAGFVAATYQRGMLLVQVPTTLLAQVDAAVGGKVAVDFRHGKNYVGTFYQPALVLADLDALLTLPQRELLGGAAEVAKYGLLAGGRLLALAERVRRSDLERGRVSQALVAGCVVQKLHVVAGDERELTGARAVLNLGHTIGHAIEAATRFTRYTHGEAVALGLRAAVWLSERCCGLPADESARALRLLDALGLPCRLEGARPDAVCDLVERDKKATAGGVGFVLLERLGAPRTNVQVPADLRRQAVVRLVEGT